MARIIWSTYVPFFSSIKLSAVTSILKENLPLFSQASGLPDPLLSRSPLKKTPLLKIPHFPLQLSSLIFLGPRPLPKSCPRNQFKCSCSTNLEGIW